MPVLRQLMQSMRSGLKEMQTLIDNLAAGKRDPTDKFQTILGQWLKNSQKKFDQLENAIKDTEKLYESVCKLFAEDPKSMQPVDFFGHLSHFITAYAMAKSDNEQEIIKRQEQEKKEKEKEERSKRVQMSKTGTMASSKTASKIGEGLSMEKDGELDDLISAIRTGKAFFQQGMAPQKRSRNRASSSASRISAGETKGITAEGLDVALAPGSSKTGANTQVLTAASSRIAPPKQQTKVIRKPVIIDDD